MTKSELIQTVRELNSTASAEFLSQFNEIELEEYVDHLLEIDTCELTAVTPPVPYN